MYLQIALLSPPYTLLTYTSLAAFPTSFWQQGLRCCIPLGSSNKLRIGILIETKETSSLPKTITIKDIIWPVEIKPILTQDLVALILEMSKRQGESIGAIAAGFLPVGLRNASEMLHCIANDTSVILSLSQIAKKSPEEKKSLAQDLLCGKNKLIPQKKKAAEEETLQLNCDPPWPIRPNAKVQLEILEYLFVHGSKNKKILQAAIGHPISQPIKTLLDAGCIRIERETEEENPLKNPAAAFMAPPPPPFTLNDEQKEALDYLTKCLSQKEQTTTLLYGVTGSGKTAVYLQLAITCLTQKRSVFLLVPEVALALKILQDTKTLYPNLPVTLYHGYQSQRTRENLWRTIDQQNPIFIIGTRSALFLPVTNLGLLILDEEHDGSFKQDDGLTYHAKEIAWFRAQQNKALLLLGSATPDIRTFYAAKMQLVHICQLKNRIKGSVLPPIELVDLRERKCMSESVSLLAKKSLDILLETVQRGEQAVILLNRRGYAPQMFCTECGKTQRCPDCDIGLTYHKARGKLVCHFCGYTRDYPSPCASCGAGSFLPLGEGTERIAEELSSYLGQNVLRLDRDTTRRPGQMEAILQAFAKQQASVLVGTQMLSKGHHFPLVTLVIAANADMGLSMPDYRATERTFQLLLQAAGRAGRGEKKGRVLLQTRDIEHYCWPFILSYDYEHFYEAEIARRKKLFYPPFSHLALIRFSHEKDEQNAPTELSLIAREIRKEAKALGVTVLGPAPSPHALLCGRKRFQCLLKAHDWGLIRQCYANALSKCTIKILRVSLDLDPVNML